MNSKVIGSIIFFILCVFIYAVSEKEEKNIDRLNKMIQLPPKKIKYL